MRYGIVGYSGRMGMEISSLFDALGHDLVLAVDENVETVTGNPEVVLAFSLPPALPATLRLCRVYGSSLILGTTGLSDNDLAEVRSFSESRPVVHSSNFGIGINILSMILGDYARMLGDWEVEIEEIHHNQKKDAPSGTALMLMEAVGRECPTHSLRMGNLPGDHAVYFARPDELLCFSHRIVNRSLLSRGALRAAEFALSAPKGYYTFQDVLRAGRNG